jgi:hypothetical protein
MLFTIVYTGDHYVVDVLAGIILGVICCAAAWRLTKKDLVAETAGTVPSLGRAAGLKLVIKPVAVGLAIMIVGILVGSYNRGQFVNRAIAYNIYVPRYVDFLNRAGEFSSNYQVQYYLGGHHFMNLDFERALFYYERCLSLSRTDKEREQSETGIRKSRANLDLRLKNIKRKLRPAF